MRRFLFPTLLAALLSPTVAMAENTWLILRYGVFGGNGRGGTSLEKIKVGNLSQCDLMGAKWMGTKLSKRENQYRNELVFGYECLEGE